MNRNVKLKIENGKLLITLFVFSIVHCQLSVIAQTGGTYEITQSIVSNGGSRSDGGTFSITGTAGQSVAGTNSSGSPYAARGGFWQEFFAPTAAMVAVSGQVLTSQNGGISRVRVTLVDAGGTTRSALTNQFGYFRFDDVETGQTYIVNVQSKRYQFANDTQVLSVNDEITDLTFTALPD